LNLPTLVVCDATAEKRKEIEELVQSQPALTYLTSVSRNDAGQEMTDQSAKLVWLELDPEPDQGIALITDWKGQHPDIHFLVSYQTLNADLVKASMHAGAIDFLDSGTWKDQLPDVVTRVLAKEKAASDAAAKKTAQSSGRFDVTADRIPAYNESINKMRHTSENDAPPPEAVSGPLVVPLPTWVVPAIFLCIVALAVALVVVKFVVK
jgi:DNA-binding NtrC family response regulator